MKKPTPLRFARACTFLAVMGVAMHATGNDRKSYTGLSCVDAYGGNQWNPNLLEYTAYGGVKRVHLLDNGNVACRVTRDITSSSGEVADWDVTIAVDEADPSVNATIAVLFATTRDGLHGFTSSMTESLGPGVHTLDGDAIAGSHDLGTLYLWVILLPGDEVRGYSISEK